MLNLSASIRCNSISTRLVRKIGVFPASRAACAHRANLAECRGEGEERSPVVELLATLDHALACPAKRVTQTCAIFCPARDEVLAHAYLLNFDLEQRLTSPHEAQRAPSGELVRARAAEKESPSFGRAR